jgi:tetratricopeptide (TPR) repeat protein
VTTHPSLAALRAEHAALAALLESHPDPAALEGARRRIIALFHQVEGELAELGRLKEEIRPLVERYRHLTPAGSAPAPLQVDHLGASTWIEKGWHLISSGDSAGALEALSRALELAPGNTEAQSLFGWAQMQSDRHDEALATFARVLAREPGNALARVNLGYICLRKRIFGEAIEHLASVIRLDNDRRAVLYAHYYLGLAYFERGMYADAEGFLGRAIALGPSLIEAYYDLGRAQWFAGRPEEARATWARGAAANRHAPWARQCVELLDRTARGEEVPRTTSS